MNRPTPSPAFDPRIADWLEGDPDHAPSEVLDTVLAALPSIPQRRAMRMPWRFPAMNRFAQLTAAAFAIVLVIGGVLILRPGGDRKTGAVLPTDQPSPMVPASPSPSAAAPSTIGAPLAIAPSDVGRTLRAGTYHVAGFAAPFAITFPPGWVVGEFGPNNITFALGGQGPLSIALAVVDKVYPDPCHPAGGSRAVKSGVDGVVAALSSVKGFELTNIGDVNIGGSAGKAFTLSNSITADAGCSGEMLPFATYETASATAADLKMFPEERDLVWVLDAGGTPVTMFVNDSAASVQVSQPVLSLSFDKGSSN